MAPLTAAVVGITVLAGGLALIFLTRPSLTAARVGRILAFLSLFIFPLFALGLGVSDQMERSKRTSFCLSCHVMEPYGKSLLVDDRSFVPAVHYQNHLMPPDHACFTCHTDYTLYGDYKAKLRGLKHVYVYYLGEIPKKIELYGPYNNRECLHCHRGSRSFEEGASHSLEPDTMAKIKSGQLSCVSSGCHEIVHNVGGLEDVTLWKEPAP